MEHINHITKKSFNLYTVSDIHLGSKFCLEDKFISILDDIRHDPDGLVYLNGDLIQGFTAKHKNFEPSSLVTGLMKPVEQAEYMTELLRPIQNKIVGVGIGNHEWDCVKAAGDVTKDIICKGLKVPYGGYKSIVTFDTRSKFLFKALFHHGSGSINSRNIDPKKRREANENSLRMKFINMGHPDCAVNIMGHVHKILCIKPEANLLLPTERAKLKQRYNVFDFETQTSSNIPENMRFYGCSGCYEINQLEGEISYAEIAGYSPSELGSIKLEVRDELITDLVPIYK